MRCRVLTTEHTTPREKWTYLSSLYQVKNLDRRHAVLNFDELFENVLSNSKDENELIQIEENLNIKEMFDKIKIKRIEDYITFDKE